MSFAPLQPARIDFSEPGLPRAPDFDDVYHPRAGALGQARQVFLRGNGLPQRWAGQPRFVVLETGFGLGNNFLATWDAWRNDAARCQRLVYVAIEKHPPLVADLARAQAHSPLPELARALVDAWPPLTPDLHHLGFDAGRVSLLLVLAELRQALPELQLEADAVYLDGFAPDRNPAMWETRSLNTLARLCRPGATVATWSVARALRDGLSSTGFVVEKAAGFGGKREMTVGRFAPRFVPPRPLGRQPLAPRQVVVVGAGLAGAGVARALAVQDVAVTVLEQHPAAAQATSGNPGGLFHGIVHREDGVHARWLRAAALRAQAVLGPLIRAGTVAGGMGLLRGERHLTAPAMQALLRTQALPETWVQAWAADAVQRILPQALPQPAWYYPGGGWIAPAGLVQHWLQHPGIALRTGCSVARLLPVNGHWHLLDAHGTTLAISEAVVLASAADAMRLLGHPAWPWHSSRGQVSWVPASGHVLSLPIADGGYALQLPDGRLLCGATSHADDPDPALRPMDHHHNLDTLRRLTGWHDLAPRPATEGRVGWRMQMQDRLPMLGPVPDPLAARPRRAAQARHHARLPGLYLATGFGSRGITHAALAGEVLAAAITGAPMPLPASLLDALDPARFAARLSRTAGS